MKTIKNTLSICPKCVKIINARVVKEDAVYLEKECHTHGRFKAKHNWDKEVIYRHMMNLPIYKDSKADGLVLNITSGCNMNCPFCYAYANERQNEEITIEEVEKLLKNYHGHIVYISGGEPTVNDNLIPIIKAIKNRGYKIGLFTNGKKLVHKFYVRLLKDSGIDFVILQFDTLKDENYVFLRGEPLYDIKIKALENLKKYNILVYLFVMLSKEKNIVELSKLVNFVSERKEYIRIINFNPVWETGRRISHEAISTSDILKAVENQTKISTSDFLECTEFSYYFFYILSKLQGRKTSVQPRCELRCYVFFDLGKVIPLTKIIDIKKVNFILRKIAQIGTDRIKILSCIILYSLFFYLLFLRTILRNRNSRMLIKSFIKSLLANISNISILNILPFTSIIIGTFQTAENLDFDMVRNCNLYSDFLPESNFIFSACVRQILFNTYFSNKDMNIHKIVESYQKLLD